MPGIMRATTEDRARTCGSLLGCGFVSCEVWCSEPSGTGSGAKCAGAAAPERGSRSARRRGSATKAEALDDVAVPLDLGLLQVVQQPAALADEQQQAATAVVVVLVLLEVLGEVADAVAEQRDLHLGRTGVALGRGVLGDDLLLGLRVGTDRHAGSLPVGRCAALQDLL